MECVSSVNTFLILIVEELSLAEYSGPNNNNSWESDYEPLIQPLLEDQQPCYILFRYAKCFKRD